MPIICPKCSHVRPADATNPDWQCPACGVCYAKVQNRSYEPVRPARDTQVAVKHSWNLGWLFKIVLLVAVGWGLSVALERRQKAGEGEEVAVVEAERDSGAGVAIANTALQVSGADASMLTDLTGRLEKGCARNKYGLSEDACVARLRDRGDLCAAKTAQNYPGQNGDVERMQIVTKAYVGCIFEG